MFEQQLLDVGPGLPPGCEPCGGDVQRLVHQFFGREKVVNQPHVISLIGKDFSAAEQQFLGAMDADQLREAPRGIHLAVVDCQNGNCFFATDQEIEAGGQHCPTAVAQTVDGSNQGFATGMQVPGVLRALLLALLALFRAEFPVFVDVCAGRERTLPRLR